MEITWTFVDGTTSTVEVEGELGDFIVESRRLEDNDDRDRRRHCWSTDALEYEGSDYGKDDDYFVEEDAADISARLALALDSLTEIQRRRLILYSQGKTLQEIADIEGTSTSVIFRSLGKARKKCKKFFD